MSFRGGLPCAARASRSMLCTSFAPTGTWRWSIPVRPRVRSSVTWKRSAANAVAAACPRGEARKLSFLPYEWPGNVRELASVIERATILARGDRLAIDAVVPKPERGARGVATRTSPERVLQTTEAAVAIETESERRARERANLVAALERSGGKVYGSGGAEPAPGRGSGDGPAPMDSPCLG